MAIIAQNSDLSGMISSDMVLTDDTSLWDTSNRITINSGHYSSGTITSGKTVYGTNTAVPNYSNVVGDFSPKKRITTRY